MKIMGEFFRHACGNFPTMQLTVKTLDISHVLFSTIHSVGTKIMFFLISKTFFQ